MKQTRNPDNREDNLEKIKKTINKTMHNTEIADETIAKTDDDRLKKTLEEKNHRRKEAINVMKREFKDE